MRQAGKTGVVTPAYVFDTDKLLGRVRLIRRALGERAKLCYAVKANPFLIEALAGEADYLEVCSPGEYDICERLGVPAEKIVLSGVNKEEEDVRRAVAACGDSAVYTAESPRQWQMLCRIAEQTGKRLPVLLRLSCGNQFGMDRGTIGKILRGGENAVKAEGIQFYAGTQKGMESVRREISLLKEFCEEFPSVRRIEYGPGLRVDYFGARPQEEEENLEEFAKLLRTLPQNCEIVAEMGRFVAADCGEYHTAVADLKKTDGNAYCIVDGGMHHLKYYGQTMAMKVPPVVHFGDASEGGTQNWTVCGSLCTAADVLLKDFPLTGAKIGDVLVFYKAGAYSVTEGAGLFLSRALPRIYTREKGALTLVRDFIQTSKINFKGE